MAEELEDPREVPWHPRFASHVVGHITAQQRFATAFAAGTPHHAWLFTGPMGIGKATLSYRLAEMVLSQSNPSQTARWMASRAHPDLIVLERGFNDAKPRRLRRDIVVDDARKLTEFFNRTAGGGGWRVAIVDAADDLNTEAANALLKLVEEPPSKALIFLISHQPGGLLRTLKSRCLRQNLAPLSTADTHVVVQHLALEPAPEPSALANAIQLSAGSPGRALALINSAGAKAFAQFAVLRDLTPASRSAVANHFSQRQAATDDFTTFMALLLEWVADAAAKAAATARGAALAEVHQKLSEAKAITEGFNMDRRNAVLAALHAINDALKAA